jgi:non-reducing end alpha-L-arabinofuranosidase
LRRLPLCLDNNNDSGADGNTAQNWTVNANGTITIDGGGLDITGAKYFNGTLVELWTCNGGADVPPMRPGDDYRA